MTAAAEGLQDGIGEELPAGGTARGEVNPRSALAGQRATRIGVTPVGLGTRMATREPPAGRSLVLLLPAILPTRITALLYSDYRFTAVRVVTVVRAMNEFAYLEATKLLSIPCHEAGRAS